MRRKLAATNKAQSTKVPYPEYYHRPLDFFIEVLGVHPWENPDGDGQADIIRAAGEHDAFSCRSGHKTGKSTSAAGLAWWWWCTRELARVVVTAPTERQVKRVIWREIRRLHRHALRPIHLDDDIPKDPATGIVSEDDREIMGFTCSDPDNFSGISGPAMFYLVDEAPGVDEAIFEALEGNRAGGARLGMFGNPTQVTGSFYNSHHRERDLFKTLHISSESAAKHGGGIPGIARMDWVEKRKAVWGVGSPMYDVRVDGNFPKEAFNTVVPLWLMQDAQARWSGEGEDQVEPTGDLVLGIDVAREGDDECVIVPRRGMYLYQPRVFPGVMDGPQLAGHAIQIAHELKQPGQTRVVMNVDYAGVGCSVVDSLAYSEDPIACGVAVNTGSASDEPEKYFNLRSQLHFGFVDWLKAGGTVPPDPKLERDLLAPQYKFTTKNALQVELKKDIKKRLKRSPDRSDAAMLAVYPTGNLVPDEQPADHYEDSRWGDAPGRGFG